MTERKRSSPFVSVVEASGCDPIKPTHDLMRREPPMPLQPKYPEHKIESHPSPDTDALWESIRKIAEGS